jgi:hypothetical protein
VSLDWQTRSGTALVMVFIGGKLTCRLVNVNRAVGKLWITLLHGVMGTLRWDGTLNYPGAPRHPFTEGEFGGAGGFGDGGVTVSGVAFRGGDSPLVEGWTRSGRGVLAFGGAGDGTLNYPVRCAATPSRKGNWRGGRQDDERCL